MQYLQAETAPAAATSHYWRSESASSRLAPARVARKHVVPTSASVPDAAASWVWAEASASAAAAVRTLQIAQIEAW